VKTVQEDKISLVLLLVHCTTVISLVLLLVHCTAVISLVLLFVHCTAVSSLVLLLVHCTAVISLVLLLVHCTAVIKFVKLQNTFVMVNIKVINYKKWGEDLKIMNRVWVRYTMVLISH
jgi:hypothetical protein